MNEEQGTPAAANEGSQDKDKVFTTDTTQQSQDEFGGDKEKRAEDYYSVDDPKKEVRTTIGDGEMHNEGLVGDGNVADVNPLSQDEQDEAEFHDSQG